jgi:hypothetical protein
MKCIILLWTWWTGRNRIREGERGRGAPVLIHNIEAYAAETIKVFKQKTSQSREVKKWSRPATGTLKQIVMHHSQKKLKMVWMGTAAQKF